MILYIYLILCFKKRRFDTDAVSFGKSLIYLSSAAGTDIQMMVGTVITDDGADNTGVPLHSTDQR